MTQIQTIREVYASFERGDVADILRRFGPRIEFRLAEGHPYQPSGEPWLGPDAVVRHFFQRAGGEWEGWKIALAALLETSDAVIVECRYSGVYRPTGKTMNAQACHVWRFHDGKIESFHQYIDTAHLQWLMRA